MPSSPINGAAHPESPPAAELRPREWMEATRTALRLRRYSRRTEEAYLGWLVRFLRFRRRLPAESIIYLGDTARVPYGTKSVESVIRYAMQFARLTRKGEPQAPDFVQRYVSWGAGPRASQYLILGAKARAVLHGRSYASTADVRAVAAPVLRHRVMTNFNAEAEGLRPDDIVRKLAELIPQDARRLTEAPPAADLFR